jgi:hypothetical protein
MSGYLAKSDNATTDNQSHYSPTTNRIPECLRCPAGLRKAHAVSGQLLRMQPLARCTLPAMLTIYE